MTVPGEFANTFVTIKYFLASYRALSDGRSGIRSLEEILTAKSFLFEWKIGWIGTCAVLRTAIHLFQIDMKSCLAASLRKGIEAEWKAIDKDRERHAIFWKFLREERNNVVKQYEWRAYEAWMKPDGTLHTQTPTLLGVLDDDARPLLLMRDGPFKGRNSLDLLKEGADWVEARIFSAIRRAGLDPDEERGVVHFQPRPTPPTPSKSLLGGWWLGDDEDTSPDPARTK